MKIQTPQPLSIKDVTEDDFESVLSFDGLNTCYSSQPGLSVLGPNKVAMNETQ